MPGNRSIFNEAVKNAYNAAWDGQWSKAIAEYRRALAEFPQDANGHLSLAHALEEAGQLEAALYECRVVAKLQPNDPLPLVQIAVLQEKLGRKADAAATMIAVAEFHASQKAMGMAVEAWHKAAALEPDRADVHERLADVYEQGGNRSLAAKERVSLAQIYARRGDKDGAIAQIKKALALDPRSKSAQAFSDELEMEAFDGLSVETGPVDQAKRAALSRLAETLLGGNPGAGRSMPPANIQPPEAPGGLTESEINALTASAIDAQSRHQLAEAIACYKKLLEAGVDRPEIKFNLGSLYLETRRLDEGVELLKQTAADPNYALASHFALGRCYRLQGKSDAALEHFLQVTRIVDLGSVRREQADELIAVYESLAESYAAKGDPERAESFSRSLEEFLTSKGWEDKLDNARQHLEAIRASGGQVSLAEVINIPESGKVLEALALAHQHLRQAKYQAASEECLRAIEIAPGYLPPHVRLGEILMKQGQVEEAKAKFLAVAELAALRGETARAESLYRQLLKVAPDDLNARSRLADLTMQLGHYDAAVAEFLELGRKFTALGQYDEAAIWLKKGIGLISTAVIPNAAARDLRYLLAEVLARKGDGAGALGVFQEILQEWPEDEQARLSVIDLEYGLGQRDAADSALDELLALYQARGELVRMISVMEMLVQHHPSEARLRGRLAEAYIKIEDREKALATLDALGELQLGKGDKREAAATIRRIIEMVPARVEEYKRLLQQIDG